MVERKAMWGQTSKPHPFEKSSHPLNEVSSLANSGFKDFPAQFFPCRSQSTGRPRLNNPAARQKSARFRVNSF
jgi:hypothetical protein